LAGEFGLLGIHNCAWTADAYLAHYARVPGVGYIDMGIDSDLARARLLFPTARRALMYTPMDLANKSMTEIRADLRRIGAEYGPSDVVFADVEAGTPDSRIVAAARACAQLTAELG
jgi:hypothetical protein